MEKFWRYKLLTKNESSAIIREGLDRLGISKEVYFGRFLHVNEGAEGWKQEIKNKSSIYRKPMIFICGLRNAIAQHATGLFVDVDKDGKVKEVKYLESLLQRNKEVMFQDKKVRAILNELKESLSAPVKIADNTEILMQSQYYSCVHFTAMNLLHMAAGIKIKGYGTAHSVKLGGDSVAHICEDLFNDNEMRFKQLEKAIKGGDREFIDEFAETHDTKVYYDKNDQGIFIYTARFADKDMAKYILGKFQFNVECGSMSKNVRDFASARKIEGFDDLFKEKGFSEGWGFEDRESKGITGVYKNIGDKVVNAWDTIKPFPARAKTSYIDDLRAAREGVPSSVIEKLASKMPLPVKRAPVVKGGGGGGPGLGI